jgi:hypothetical protein
MKMSVGIADYLFFFLAVLGIYQIRRQDVGTEYRTWLPNPIHLLHGKRLHCAEGRRHQSSARRCDCSARRYRVGSVQVEVWERHHDRRGDSYDELQLLKLQKPRSKRNRLDPPSPRLVSGAFCGVLGRLIGV